MNCDFMKGFISYCKYSRMYEFCYILIGALGKNHGVVEMGVVAGERATL